MRFYNKHNRRERHELAISFRHKGYWIFDESNVYDLKYAVSVYHGRFDYGVDKPLKRFLSISDAINYIERRPQVELDKLLKSRHRYPLNSTNIMMAVLDHMEARAITADKKIRVSSQHAKAKDGMKTIGLHLFLRLRSFVDHHPDLYDSAFGTSMVLYHKNSKDSILSVNIDEDKKAFVVKARITGICDDPPSVRTFLVPSMLLDDADKYAAEREYEIKGRK